MDGVIVFFWFNDQTKQLLYIPPHHLSCKYSLTKKEDLFVYFWFLFKIWILRFLELKNKLWTKNFWAVIASCNSWEHSPSLHLQPPSPQRSPSQQTCGTWGGSSGPHWDTNIRSLCLQYLQYPHRYCFDWKLENSGQTERADGCERKKNVSYLSTQNWLKLWREN